MAIVLGANRYGKAETRLFRVNRDTERHTVRDLNVSSSLTGDFADAHLAGDQSNVLPTDTQKNTVFAFAKKVGVGEIEDFALALARHFVDDVAPVTGADIRIEEHAWERIPVGADGHAHAFTRAGHEVRTTHLARGALSWLRMLDDPKIVARFDVVEVLMRDDGEPHVNVIEDAFPLPEPFVS
jgi:urate oxidase